MAEIPRSEGRSAFGASPQGYAVGRPEYPAQVFELLRTRCHAGPSTRVLEIGPGTGQATEPLLALGVRSLMAVEPDARLADFLRQRLREASAGRLQVRSVGFEEADLPAGGFDLIVAATCYHWLEPEVAARKAHRLLAPEGWLAIWWTIFRHPFRRDEFSEATQSLFEGLDTNPSHHGGDQLPFGLDVEARRAELLAAGFSAVDHELIPWKIVLNAAQTQALYGTFSQVARLSPAAKTDFLARLADIVNQRFGGKVERMFSTAVYLARRS